MFTIKFINICSSSHILKYIKLTIIALKKKKSEKGKNVTRMRKRSVSFSEEITIIGYHIVPEIDREKNERKKLDKIDRSRKFEPKTLNEQNDDVSDSNIEVALPKPFLTNLTHKKMMTNSNKSSCTNPQFQELDDMDSADNVVLREKSSVKVEKFPP